MIVFLTNSNAAGVQTTSKHRLNLKIYYELFKLIFFNSHILTGSYNNFFKSFNRNSKQELMFECSREQTKPRQQLRPKRVTSSNLSNGQANGNSSPLLNSKRNNIMNGKTNCYKDEVSVDNLDFTKKILHTSWHPKDNIIAIAATNNLYLFYNKENTSPTSSMASYISSCNTISSNSSMNCFNTLSNNTFSTTPINSQNTSQIQNSQNQLNQIQLNTSFYTAPSSGFTNTPNVQTPQTSSQNTTMSL